ncbi:MAG: hypothetical protein ACQSGP_20930 [Frankia sp.]
MYGWIWRRLPGGPAGRAFLALVLLAVVSVVLLFVLFPAVEPHLPFSHVTVDQPAVPT